MKEEWIMELCPRDSMRMRLDYTENEIQNHRYHVVDGVLPRDMYIFSVASFLEEALDSMKLSLIVTGVCKEVIVSPGIFSAWVFFFMFSGG